jgi:hypothetical protein
MAFNLIRNSRVYFTTKLTAGVVDATAHTATTTYELQVLDGLSFSQNTTAETVTLNEAGGTPVRGQRSFNTALEAVDFSFSTYIRPADAGLAVYAEEAVLWNALLGTGAIGSGGAAWSATGGVGTIVATNSQAHQLQQFGMIIVVDETTFIIDNCALDQASIDFGLDGIAMVAWTGKGTAIRQLAKTTIAVDGFTLSGGIAGVVKPKDTTAGYIANKLSTLAITSGINGTGQLYTVPITGGSLTIANNITYLTPANLGQVNKPITYFTGTRSITGSLNAYLRTGTVGDTGSLLSALLASSSTDIDPEFKIVVTLIGSPNTTTVVFTMLAAVLTIPSVSTEQVVSTTISFTAQGSNGAAFDIGAANELTIAYNMAVA